MVRKAPIQIGPHDVLPEYSRSVFVALASRCPWRRQFWIGRAPALRRGDPFGDLCHSSITSITSGCRPLPDRLRTVARRPVIRDPARLCAANACDGESYPVPATCDQIVLACWYTDISLFVQPILSWPRVTRVTSALAPQGHFNP